MTADRVSLINLLTKYRTVNRKGCRGCGNPWFFAMEQAYVCTTCGQDLTRPLDDPYEPKENANDRPD